MPTSLSATSPYLSNTSRDGDATPPCAAVPMHHCCFGEGIVPNTQPDHPVAQHEATTSHHIAITGSRG